MVRVGGDGRGGFGPGGVQPTAVRWQTGPGKAQSCRKDPRQEILPVVLYSCVWSPVSEAEASTCEALPAFPQNLAGTEIWYVQNDFELDYDFSVY